MCTDNQRCGHIGCELENQYNRLWYYILSHDWVTVIKIANEVQKLAGR